MILVTSIVALFCASALAQDLPFEQDPDVILISPEGASSAFGSEVAGLGDINGDGFYDVGVGDPFYEASDTVNSGMVCFYFGSAVGLDEFPSTSISGVDLELGEYAYLGLHIQTAGDVDADGYADVLVDYHGTGALLYGSSIGINSVPFMFEHPDPEGSDESAASLWSAGDVNADGFADVAMGLYSVDGHGSAPGISYAIYHGSTSGVAVSPDTIVSVSTLFIDDPDAYPGQVAGGIDVNNDGFDDLVVSFHVGVEYTDGLIYVFFGSTSGLEDSAAGPYLIEGSSLRAVGDIDGDGRGEMASWGDWYDVYDYGGAVWAVYPISSPGLGLTPLEIPLSEVIQEVAPLGDVNLDGYDDFVIGAVSETGGAAIGASVYFGGEDPAYQRVQVLEHGGDLSEYGWAVDGAGDVNGDGVPDLVVGGDASGVFVYFGIPLPEEGDTGSPQDSGNDEHVEGDSGDGAPSVSDPGREHSSKAGCACSGGGFTAGGRPGSSLPVSFVLTCLVLARWKRAGRADRPG